MTKKNLPKRESDVEDCISRSTLEDICRLREVLDRASVPLPTYIWYDGLMHKVIDAEPFYKETAKNIRRNIEDFKQDLIMCSDMTLSKCLDYLDHIDTLAEQIEKQ